jgi:hypothetical protein
VEEYIEYVDKFLFSLEVKMGNEYPKHIIAVSAYVTNEKGEALLVKTHWRSDTVNHLGDKWRKENH